MERTFDRCEAILADLDLGEVRRWKQEHPGARAIAYFPVYAPMEIIHAAGFLPVGLAGAGDRLDLQHADALFGSFICSIVKTTMEMGRTGHLEPLDGLLFSSICDSARNLAFVMKRNLPQMYVDFLHLPQNPGSPASVDFLAEEYARLARELERLRCTPITAGALHNAIRLYNQNRALVRNLCALRSASPHLVTAREAYLLVRAGYFLPVEEHNAILEEALAALPSRKAKRRDSLRIVIEGAFCEQPPLDLIRLVEDAGCYIVDDDFVLGRNWFLDDVATDEEPLRALARAYVEQARYSSVRHDFRHPRWEALAEKVRRTRADAVIFLIAKFCEPAYFDYVLYKKKLDEMGIPHLLVEFEEKMFTFERMRMEVETFVESLVFD